MSDRCIPSSALATLVSRAVLAWFAATSAAAEPPSATLAIKGRVVDATGEPVPEARIVALKRDTSNDIEHPTAKTLGDGVADSDGAFSLELTATSLPDALIVRADGFATEWLTDFEVVEPVEVVLLPGATLSGTLVTNDVAASPIGGARIELYYANKPRPEQALKHPGVNSDRDGNWTLDGLEPGSHPLRVQAVGRRTEYLVASVEHGATRRIATTMAPASIVKGQVSGDDGAVPGAVVTASPATAAMIRPGRRLMTADRVRTETDTEGRFILSELAPGTEFTVVVDKSGYAPTSVALHAPALGMEAQLDVVLSRGGRLSGTVVDREEKSIANASIWLEPVDDAGDPATSSSPYDTRQFRRNFAVIQSRFGRHRGSTQQTDGSGRFSFDPSPIGPHRIVVFTGGRSFSDERVYDLEAGHPIAGAIVQLDLGRAVSGVVVDDNGEPIAAAQVRANSRLAMTQELHWTQSDDDGRFTLRGLTASSCDLHASADGHATTGMRDVDVTSGTVRVVLERAGTITGRVTLPGEVAAGVVHVELGSAVARDGTSRYGRRSATLPTVDGVYTFEGAAAGRHDVTFQAAGHRPSAVRRVEVTAGATTSGVDVELERGATIQGVVLTKVTNLPVVGARVIPATTDRDLERWAFGEGELIAAYTDRDGRFTLEGLADGRMVVRVTHDAFADATIHGVRVNRDSPDSELRIELHQGATIAGTVERGDGLPAAGVSVMLQANVMAPPHDSVISDDLGRFRFDRLSPQLFTLSASLSDGLRLSTTVDLVGAETAEVTLRRSGERLEGQLLRGGQPLAGAMLGFAPVEVATLDSGPDVITDSAGRYHVSSMPAGRYNVRITGPEHLGVRRAFLEGVEFAFDMPATAHTRDFVLPGIALAGAIRDGDGNPVADAQLDARRLDVGFGTRSSSSTQSGSDGRFRLEMPAAARYRLYVNKLGLPSHSLDIEVGAAGRDDLLIDLDVALVLTGQVVDGNGQPIAYAVVVSRGDSGSRSHDRSDVDGRFSLNLSKLEPVTLTAYADGQAPALIAGHMPTLEQVVLTLGLGGSLALELAGEPAARADAQVMLAPADTASGPGPPRPHYSPQTDLELRAHGKTVIEHLAPGAYELRVTTRDGDIERTFQIVEGETTTLLLSP